MTLITCLVHFKLCFFQSRYSVQSEDRPYLSSRSSTICSSTFGTSFRANDIVYAHHKAGSQNLIHHGLGTSDIKYQRPGPPKASQNPDQKTYGGDLLKKHSQHFTQDKPFTPKTLKSDKSSYLSKYRYYRAPLKKQCQAKLMQQEKDSGRYGQNTSLDWYSMQQPYTVYIIYHLHLLCMSTAQKTRKGQMRHLR